MLRTNCKLAQLAATLTLLHIVSIPQQVSMAAAHRRKAAVDQANTTIAKIVRFPPALGSTLGAQQSVVNCRVGVLTLAPVEHTKRQSLTLASCADSLWNVGPGVRPSMARHSLRLAYARTSKSTSNGKLHDTITALDWRFLQP
ncbi:hypothetical protein UP10_40650 [Bradyrhizobium sp. LTSPM299]|nr:hypothetical protein UP10_40650 [Bradyrhizobium sp. LTSPM299]